MSDDQQQVEQYRKTVEAKVEQEKKNRGSELETSSGDDGPPIEFVQKCYLSNEVGDSLLFNHLHRDKFINNVLSKDGWFYYVGPHWEIDYHKKAKAAAEAVVEQYLRLLKPITDALADLDFNNKDDKPEIKSLTFKKKNLLARIDRLRSDRGRNSMLNCAISNSDPLTIHPDQLDKEPWLFPCQNGVIDLRSGSFREGSPADYLTISSPTMWEGIEAQCPVWEKTLLEIFDNNIETIKYLQKVLGYTITGLKSERIFIVFYGPHGQNGKGTIIDTLFHVLGPLAGPIQTELLMSQKFARSTSGPSPDILAMKGRRLAWASETERHHSFAAGQIKRYSGGDPLLGRGLNDRDQTTFWPTHVLFLLCNDRPKAPAKDNAFWERIKVFHFPFSFLSKQTESYHRPVNKYLDLELQKEAPGILAWHVKGCLLWQKEGLIPPDKVVSDSLEYRNNEDDIQHFIDDCCHVDKTNADKENRENATALYVKFRDWWEKRNTTKAMNQKEFADQLILKGFTKVKSDRVYYQFLKLVVTLESD